MKDENWLSQVFFILHSSAFILSIWSCGLAAKAALLQGDERWFESTQDYLGTRAQVRQRQSGSA
jgi:hypothetical protein